MVNLINFWKDQNLNMLIKEFERINNNINLFSVFGNKNNIDKYQKKVLLIGENTDRDKYRIYSDENILQKFDLVLGFKYHKLDNYIRYPLWLYHNFYFMSQKDKYINFIKQHQQVTSYNINNKKDCCLVARNDINNLRKPLLKRLDNMCVDCPSTIGKNCKSIEEYGLTKIDFLKNYIFNICPENSISEGYTTEKIFEATFGNCIPIYYGELGDIEKQILNQKRIIFINEISEKELDRANDFITGLFKNKDKLLEFYNRPIYNERSEDIILNLISKFEARLRSI
jgi:hypothetical protein